MVEDDHGGKLPGDDYRRREVELLEPVYRPVVGVALTLFKVMGWDIQATGTENVPPRGPAVIATNHVGYLDFVFVGAAARRSGRLIRFLAKKEVFDHKVAGPLMRGMRHVPVDRFGRASDAVEAAVTALRSGEVIGMFPESTINPSFVPGEGRSGAARMAMEAGAPLVPGAVWGSQRILTKGRPKNFQRKIVLSVAFGPPIGYSPDEDPKDVTARLMQRISGLLTATQRAYPQAPADDSDRWWLPAHMGGTAPTVEEAAEILAEQRAERARRARSSRP